MNLSMEEFNCQKKSEALYVKCELEGGGNLRLEMSEGEFLTEVFLTHEEIPRLIQHLIEVYDEYEQNRR